MEVSPLELERVPLSGVTLIEASAGTGKTYTLAALFVRLLLETELTVDQILVVTYTRAATAELRVRIRKRIGETLEALDSTELPEDSVLAGLVEQARVTGQTARKRSLLASALAAFDEAAIFTIHGFCQRVLKRYAFESGVAFEVELSEDQAQLVDEIICDFWAKQLAVASPEFVAALEDSAVSIESLARLARRALPNPDLSIVPSAAPAPAVAAELSAFAKARARTGELWKNNRESLMQLLLSSGLRGNVFGPKQVHDKYAPALDRLLDGSVFDLPDWLGKLTPEGLTQHCNKGKVAPRHAFFDACAELVPCADALRARLNQHVHAFLHDFVGYVRAELPRRSEARGEMGFEDLLLHVFRALHGSHGVRLAELVRTTYRAALIDEFQDTDPVQLEVFRRIYVPAARDGVEPRPALFLIGDPKQAIYAFRGADIFAYLAASRHAIDRVHTLAVNYRSDPSVVRAVELLFKRAALPFVFSEIQYRPVVARPGASDELVSPALEFLFVTRPPDMDKLRPRGDVERELPARIAAEIAQLLSRGELLKGAPVKPGDIAVLCRTNAQAGLVQMALRERGIPAVLDGDASVFDSAMAEELGRLLWAMAEPADPARLRAALATQGLGYTADDLLQLEADESAWDGWVQRCQRLQNAWQTRGFLCALHALCEECQVTQRLLALSDGERRYTDLWHLAELLHEAEQRTRKGPRALLDFYRRERAGLATNEGMAIDDVQLRLESDAHAVTLTTIHKSKGLEYPLVYCPFLWASSALSAREKQMPLYHDRHADDRARLMLPASSDDPQLKEAIATADREALAESMRLLYVALTRAKHRISVVWGGVSGAERSALGYLLHQPAGDWSDVDALREATAERITQASDAELRADLDQLAHALIASPVQLAPEQPVSFSVRELRPAKDGAEYRPEDGVLAELTPRELRWPSYPQSRVGSFSGLVQGHVAHGSGARLPVDLAEGLDRDARAVVPTLPSVPLAAAAPESAQEPIALADLPAGAGFGHLVHAVYEHADFQSSELELLPLVGRVLTDYAAEPSWAPQLSAAIYDTFQTPLSPAGGDLPCLAKIAMTQRLTELEFMFPVEAAAAPLEARGALRSLQLAQLLARHAQTERERSYAEQLAKLRFAPLRGFLRGFVDLIAEHDGRFYVLDYKSNHLGEWPSDYRRPQLEAAMHKHHYPLQYLLYTVALHRYLGLRLRGYEYDRHFGGVYYLFMRGMSTRHPPGTGVFFERPSAGLVAELSSLLQVLEAVP
jgi:exodeoxyribonuclease V beta subunit